MIRAEWIVVIAVVASAVSCHRAEPTGEPTGLAVAEVTRQLGPRRFTQPWISVFGHYVPCEPESLSQDVEPGYCSSPTLPRTTIAEAMWPRRRGASATDSADERDADEFHAVALWDLRWGQLDDAIAGLGDARDRAPGDWRLRNDLGSAYLLRAVAALGTDLLAALEELDRAVAAGPDRLPARFNFALALEAMHLPAAAVGAWQAFLDLDPPPGWRTEAEAAIAVERERSRTPDLQRFTAELRSSLATRRPSSIERQVRASPQDSLRFAEEEVMGGWSHAVTASDADGAATSLVEAELLGEALVAVMGDSYVAATAAEAASLPRARTVELAAAVSWYLAGRRSYDARQLEQAEDQLLRAQEAASHFGAPLRLWIDFYLALCDYWKGDPNTQDRFLAIIREATGRDLPVLEGYLAWMSGLMAIEAGRFTAGYEDLTRGLELFETLGLHDAAGTLRVLRSDTLLRVGQVTAAWDEIWRAVSRARDFREPRHLSAAWDQAARVATALGYIRAAPYLHAEALRAAQRTASPLTAVGAAVTSATAWLRLGEQNEALRDLTIARRWAARIRDPGVRARSEAAILVAESRATRPGGEPAAINRLGDAIQHYQEIDLPVLLPELLLERARLELEAGRLKDGEDDLSHALGLMEVERRSIADVEWRVSYSDTTRPALDLLIRHLLESSDDWGAIPALTDLARDPAYFAGLASRTTGDLFVRRYEIDLDLRPGEALLSATLLSDRIVVWVIRDGQLSVASTPLREEESAWRLAALARSPSRADLEWLYDRMVRPVDNRLAGVDRLFVALDRGLRGVAVAALLDRETGRPLLRRFPIVHVPAAIILAESETVHRAVPTDRLAVAGAAAAPGFQPLPAVTAEVAGLRRLYPQSEEIANLGSPEELERAGSRADILHFAGHAVSNPLVPRLSHLAFGARSVYAGEIRQLRMRRAKTVVLASCETVVSDPRDSSGVLSLAVAFLEAGSSWVVASVWPVEDQVARRFSERFHEELRRDPSPDRALRKTQLWLLDRDPDLDLRAWAGYQAIAR